MLRKDGINGLVGLRELWVSAGKDGCPRTAARAFHLCSRSYCRLGVCVGSSCPGAQKLEGAKAPLSLVRNLNELALGSTQC